MHAKGKIVDNRVMLSNYWGQLRNNAELGSLELVDEVVELTIEFFLFILLFVDRELQFADDLFVEEEVDEDVVVLIEHSILYLNYLQEIALHLFQLIKYSQDVGKLALRAAELGSDQIAHLASHDVDVAQVLPALFCEL